MILPSRGFGGPVPVPISIPTVSLTEKAVDVWALSAQFPKVQNDEDFAQGNNWQKNLSKKTRDKENMD